MLWKVKAFFLWLVVEIRGNRTYNALPQMTDERHEFTLTLLRPLLFGEHLFPCPRLSLCCLHWSTWIYGSCFAGTSPFGLKRGRRLYDISGTTAVNMALFPASSHHQQDLSLPCPVSFPFCPLCYTLCPTSPPSPLLSDLTSQVWWCVASNYGSSLKCSLLVCYAYCQKPFYSNGIVFHCHKLLLTLAQSNLHRIGPLG